MVKIMTRKSKSLAREQIEREALASAKTERSFANYPAIFEGFAAKGIPESEIIPRENVLTYHAWRAVGRQVRRGESGVKVVTMISAKAKTEGEAADAEMYKFPRATTVFHVSQTDAIAVVS